MLRHAAHPGADTGEPVAGVDWGPVREPAAVAPSQMSEPQNLRTFLNFLLGIQESRIRVS